MLLPALYQAVVLNSSAQLPLCGRLRSTNDVNVRLLRSRDGTRYHFSKRKLMLESSDPTESRLPGLPSSSRHASR